ncbi:hypothetical protein DE146DRAFT_185138 [Phaeosphaeria sp. MPI-PUGE-AT-0046c]|nr:hypothetical protein DE146DRAFT_185138 [Phaeosphaeria sp. MPI-PUGE-AT-0046c]
MSEIENRFVKKGFWINQEHGNILGQTLTVETRTGTIIVALLTIMASVGTAQLWNICTFLYHQFCAHGKATDGLYWQHQALLRTMPTPTALMADTIKLSWAWRSKLPRAFLRSSLPFLVALSFAIASIAAGISTAFAIDSSNIQILVDSPVCARFNYTKVYENRTTSTLLASIKATVDTYASNCYQDKPSLPEPCHNTFARTNITFHASAAPCPWNKAICRGGEVPALLMDSGMVDLRTHFGLNVPPQETVKIQKKTTCSVLPIENRIVERDASWWAARGFKDTKTTIEYGTYRNTDRELRPEATFIQANALSKYQQSYGSSSIMSYLQPDLSFIGVDPIPEMQRDDADVALAAIWLNDVTYEKPVEDPLFSAHKEYIYTPGGGYPNETKFKSDYAAGVVGCAQQYRFCIPQAGTKDFCTQLSGSPLDNFTESFPHLKPVQRSLLQVLQSISRLASIEDGAQMQNIQAKSYLFDNFSPGLPSDQWKKEVIAWEARVWTSYQALIAAAIGGPAVFDENAHEYIEPVDNEGDRQMCKSLKMRKSGSFANINVFALTFIIAFSVTITLINTLILRFFIFMARFRAALAPRIDHWVQDGIFQLQRRAFEAQGQGCWKNLDQEIPITLDGENLRELPVESSLVLRPGEGRRLAKWAKLRKTGTNITETTLEEGSEEEITIEKIVRRPTAGTDTVTLVGVEVVEKNGLKKVKSCESGEK